MADVPDTFAEVKLRRKRLFEQLATAPAVTVLGVVAPSGAGGSKLRGDEFWTFQFALDAWRIDTGKVQTRPLTIQREVTDEVLKRYRGQIAPYAVLRIHARIVADSLLGTPQGLLENVIGIETSDRELNDFAGQLQVPVTHVDPILGIFTLNRRASCFLAKSSGTVIPFLSISRRRNRSRSKQH